MRQKLVTLISALITLLFATSSMAIEMNEIGAVDIHGFITQGYLGSSDNNFYSDTEDDGTFQFNEAGINFSADASDRLRVGLQLFARDLGRMGNKAITVDWAFADYNFNDWLNLRAGKFKTAAGLYNSSRDVDMLRTNIFLPQSVYLEGWRDSLNATDGFELYGYIFAGPAGSFSYNLQAGVIQIKKDGGEARLLEDQVPTWTGLKVTDDPDVQRFNTASLVWETPLEGLKLGASATNNVFSAPTSWGFSAIRNDLTNLSVSETISYGALSQAVGGTPDPTQIAGWNADEALRTYNTNFDVNMIVAIYSIEYSYGNLLFSAEYSKNNYKLHLNGPISGINDHNEFDAEGYYANVSYRFTDWLEIGTYYSEYYANSDDKDGTETTSKYATGGSAYPPGLEHRRWLKDACLTTRFDLTRNWILKLEVHSMNGTAVMFNDENTDEDGNLTFVKDWILYGAKLSFSF